MNDLFEVLFPKPSYCTCIKAEVNIIMIKKENYIFGLISNTENYILGVLFFLIVFLGQTFISLDTPPPTYNKYYNIFSQGNFIINSIDVNYDLFTFLIDCLSKWGQKSGSDFLVLA